MNEATVQTTDGHLDVEFTSNFFEHILSRDLLHVCMKQVHRNVKPGGIMIAMGRNIRVLYGHFWDFIDHSLALSDISMEDVYGLHDLEIVRSHMKLQPYRMTRSRLPLWTVNLYRKLPIIWLIVGKQFLVVGRKAN